MESFVIRTVESFAEPEFSRVQRLVFADMQQVSTELAAVTEGEADSRARWTAQHAAMHRLGAYEGDRLIGWSFGWPERGQVFYMANSGCCHRIGGGASTRLCSPPCASTRAPRVRSRSVRSTRS